MLFPGQAEIHHPPESCDGEMIPSITDEQLTEVFDRSGNTKAFGLDGITKNAKS